MKLSEKRRTFRNAVHEKNMMQKNKAIKKLEIHRKIYLKICTQM